MKKNAAAKINLALDIIGRRENGYHDLRMIMQSIPLYDEIDFSKTESGIGISEIKTESGDFIDLPKDSENIAVRAAELLFHEFHLPGGLDMKITKRIPVAAGLAGGSADAAAALLTVNEMFDLRLSAEELCRFGVRLGADVPFCIQGGTMLAEGIGEKLTPVAGLKNCALLLCKPFNGVSTKEVYRKFDDLSPEEVSVYRNGKSIDRLIDGLFEKDADLVAGNMYNVLSLVTEKIHGDVSDLLAAISECGARQALLSGSGPTCFGIFDTLPEAEAAAETIRKKRKPEFLRCFQI